MKNNKGFTFVEILAAVTILGILSVIAISGVSRILERSHNEYYKNQEKNLVLAAQSYMNNNKSKMPKVIGKKTKVTAKTLKEANYLKKDITEYDGKTVCDEDNTYVNVFKYGKTDYSYTAVVSCTNYANKEVAGENAAPKIDVDFSTNKEDLRNAKVTINMLGDSSGNTKILSYNYSLYVVVKSGSNVKYVELYNTGNREAGRVSSLTKTIDVSKYTISSKPVGLQVRVTVTNINGISKTVYESKGYEDTTKPTCDIKDEDKPDTQSGVKDWVNNQRTITVGCKDGNGSGCTKNSYTKTFTKDNYKDYITISDNAGNSRNCYVTSYIDKTAPTLTVKVYKAGTDNKKTGNAIATSTVDNTTKTATINSSDFANNVNGWLNKANYPNGVVIEINATDNIALNKVDYKENAKNIKANDSTYKTTTTKFSQDYPKEFTSENIQPIKSNTLENNALPTIQLVDEGARYATVAVTDGYQNKVSIVLNINIDRTKPTAPTVNGYQKKNGDSVSSETGLSGYTFDTWLKGWVLTKASGSTDSMSGVEGYFLTTSGQSTDVTDSKQVYRNVNVEEGIVTIKYRARDYAGNWSDYTTKTVKLDRKAPTNPTVRGYKRSNSTNLGCSDSVRGLSSYTSNTWYSGYVYTKASGSTDAGSGGVNYYLTTTGQDSNANNANQSCRNIAAETTVTNVYKTCDAVGNCNSGITFTIKLDRGNPSCSVGSYGHQCETGGVSATVTCTDRVSGVAKCAGDDKNGTSPVTSGKSGKKSDTTYRVYDQAGNSSSCELTVTEVDQSNYRTRSRWCASCSSAGCARYNTYWETEYYLTAAENGCPGTWRHNRNCGTSESSTNRCCEIHVERQGSCAEYNSSCSSCGYDYGSWGGWNGWSNSGCSDSDTKDCSYRTVYKHSSNSC